jgi:hypothetical protein
VSASVTRAGSVVTQTQAGDGTGGRVLVGAGTLSQSG